MELKTALETITHFSHIFAEKEIYCIRESRDEAIPQLLEIVRNALESAQLEDEDVDDPAYAMYLLAEFGVRDLFESLIRMLELDEDTADWLLGDLITEDMGSLIATVACYDDIARIKTVIENSGINEFQRSAAIYALITMYAAGKYERRELVDYFRYLLDERGGDDELLMNHVAMACLDVKAREFYPRLREYAEAGKFEEGFFDDDDFSAEGEPEPEDSIIEELLSNRWFSLVTDTVESMKHWACFNEKPAERKRVYIDNLPEETIVKGKKVGRNAPCPCGSGRKYKNCCMTGALV